MALWNGRLVLRRHADGTVENRFGRKTGGAATVLYDGAAVLVDQSIRDKYREGGDLVNEDRVHCYLPSFPNPRIGDEAETLRKGITRIGRVVEVSLTNNRVVVRYEGQSG